MKSPFFRRKVKRGVQLGRKLGFPTINLNVGHFGKHFSRGVYRANIEVRSHNYPALLYFGPKLKQKQDVLEIYIYKFSSTLYDQWISFKVDRFIRNPQKFASPAALQKQMQKDLQKLTKKM